MEYVQDNPPTLNVILYETTRAGEHVWEAFVPYDYSAFATFRSSEGLRVAGDTKKETLNKVKEFLGVREPDIHIIVQEFGNKLIY